MAYIERRWLPVLVLAVAVLVAAEIIDPPPAAADLSADTGAWLAFAGAMTMLVGAILSLGRISVAIAVEGREVQRVSAVDQRQQTTDSGAAVAPPAEPAAPPTAPTTPVDPVEPGPGR
jgi:hypothetical protein